MRIQKTKLIPLNFWHQESRYVAGRLKAGGLVVFPTETVYGIAAHPDWPGAIKRIYELKKRAMDKPLQYLISDPETVYRFMPEIPLPARRLMKMFWPGPLTLVFRLDEENTVGLRLPDHAVALKLIKLAGGILCGTSANMSGYPDTDDFACARALFNGKVDVIIDGGECEMGKPSSVVLIEGESVRVLREGALSKTRIHEYAY